MRLASIPSGHVSSPSSPSSPPSAPCCSLAQRSIGAAARTPIAHRSLPYGTPIGKIEFQSDRHYSTWFCDRGQRSRAIHKQARGRFPVPMLAHEDSPREPIHAPPRAPFRALILPERFLLEALT